VPPSRRFHIATKTFGEIARDRCSKFLIELRGIFDPHLIVASLATSDWKRSQGVCECLYLRDLYPLAFVWPKAAYSCYIFVAVMWPVPDRRIEKAAER
jgi:hypothetical protein